MGKVKKFISFAVVLSMVFSLVVPAISFAATDIADTKYEEAVEKLIALDTIKGYEDGTFRPYNSITRAELATVITFVLGLQDAADLAKTTATRFSDVKVNEWYTGYINIAANENIFVGYPDGTFQPNKEVSYAEAATMLVNALGLKQVVDRTGGSWPSNYMSKASQLGITKDIAGVSGSDDAIRGDICLMAWQTLLQNQWGPIGFNGQGEITYGNLGKTLIQEKYPDFVYTEGTVTKPKYFEDVEIINIPATKNTLQANQIEIEYEGIAGMLGITQQTASKTKAYMSDGTGNKIVVIVPDGTATSDLLGREATMFFGKDNKVVYLKATSDENAGIVESIKAATSKIKIDGTEYTLTSDARVYINNVEIDETIIADASSADKLGLIDTLNTTLNKPVIKANMLMDSSNKITSLQVNIAGSFTIETLAAGDSDYEFGQFVVREIRSDSAIVSLDGTRQFKADDIDEEEEILVVKNGNTATAGDIEIGNVVMTAKDTSGNITMIMITDRTITGTLDRVSSNYAVTIDGEAYKQGIGAELSTTSDIEDTAAISSDVATLIGNEVTITLDNNGSYVLIMGDSDVSLAGQYGIVARTPIASEVMYDEDNNPYIRLQVIDEAGNKTSITVNGKSSDEFKQVDGDEVISVDPGAGNDWTDSMLTEFTKGTFIKYSTESDGRSVKVRNLTKLENAVLGSEPALAEMDDKNNVLSLLTIADEDTVVKNSNKSFKDSDGKTYYVTNSTVILNKNGDKLERISGWETLVNNTDETENMLRGTTPLAVYNQNSRIVRYLIINDDGTMYQATEDKYGVILDILAGTNGSGDKVWMVKIFSEGEMNTYEVADISTDLDTVLFGQEGDLIRYDVKDGIFEQTNAGDIKIDMEAWLDDADFDEFIDDDVADRDQLVVDEILGTLITFKEVDGTAINPISVSDDAVVYDLSGMNPKMSSMAEMSGRVVMYFDTDGDATEYEIIIILE